MTRRYHQLVAGLPHLLRFDRLKTLPIGRQRFEERLASLDPADAAVLSWLRGALWPERQSLRFVGKAPAVLPPSVLALAGRAAVIRTVFAARYGIKDAVALEQERLGAIWDSADRLTIPYGFGLDAVMRAVIRWDVATAWLAGDPAKSETRIETFACALIANERAALEAKHGGW